MYKNLKYITVLLLLFSQQSLAVDSEEVAKKLANPLESIITIPIQVNYLPNMGVNDEGDK